MKILITGANGTIGSDLVNFFSKDNKVYAFYRTPNFASKNLKNKNIKWIKQDLIKEILIKIKPRIIIHCAVTHPFSKKNSYLDFNTLLNISTKKNKKIGYFEIRDKDWIDVGQIDKYKNYLNKSI